MGDLPFFNPDIEYEENPVVSDYCNHIRAAKAVIIASPEYAHGVTGVMKNALDWVVGTGEFMQKPTLVINCSHSSIIANLALRETLSVMEAQVIPFSFPLKSHGITVDSILANPELNAKLDEIAQMLTIPD
jgi:chromate reductase, NAD(P)H dehydrogenase (quinone)